MEQENFKNEETQTLLKFKESEKNGELIGFVYKNEVGNLIGVHEDDPRNKRICILSKDIDKSSVSPNVLYAVSLSFMPNYKGYIVNKVFPAKFKAMVYTQINKSVCQAVLKYGNRKIYYNPLSGKSDFSSTAEGAMELVINNKDISNRDESVEAFQRAIKLVDTHIKALPKAKVETLISPKCFYQTIITFGKKKIYYNPFDGVPGVETVLSKVLKRLRYSIDFVNKREVIEAVQRSAKIVNKHLVADGYMLPKQVI